MDQGCRHTYTSTLSTLIYIFRIVGYTLNTSESVYIEIKQNRLWRAPEYALIACVAAGDQTVDDVAACVEDGPYSLIMIDHCLVTGTYNYWCRPRPPAWCQWHTRILCRPPPPCALLIKAKVKQNRRPECVDKALM